MNGLDFEVKGPNVTKKAKARRRETDKIPLDIIPRGILVIPGHNSPSYNISSGGISSGSFREDFVWVDYDQGIVLDFRCRTSIEFVNESIYRL